MPTMTVAHATFLQLSLPPSMLQSGVYTLEVEGKAITAENPVLVRPETDNVAGEKYTLKVPDLRVVEAATNAFATHVYATLDFMNDELLAQKSDVKFEVSTDGGVTYSEVNTTLESDTYSSSSSRVAGVGTSVYHITGLERIDNLHIPRPSWQ